MKKCLNCVITECFLDTNQKNKIVQTIKNVVNLIFVSNNFIHINFEEDDRFYFIVDTSDKYKGDFETSSTSTI